MRNQIRPFSALCALLFVAVACTRGQPNGAGTPTAVPTAETTSNPEAIAWLKSNAIPFKTTKPVSGFDDLQPLKKIIGNARIVAIGQDTHGTHEFQEMNTRLVEFLVEEMGFNAWALEASMPESFLVDDYVQTGSGDPERLLSGLHFWIWNTQEVLDTIKWMRAHNEKPAANRVSFYGFDVPYTTLPVDNVLSYLRKVDPTAAQPTQALYRCFLRDLPRQSGDSNPQPFSQACTDNLRQAYDDLLKQQPKYERLSSIGEFALALHNARIILQIDSAYQRGIDFSGRDRAMAENVSWILNQAGPDAKIVLSAHNFHVDMNSPGYRSMGSFLREQYGKEMIVFGTSFYSGSVNMMILPENQPTVHPVPLPPDDSYESYFHRTGIPQFFVDLRNLEPGSPAANWVDGPHSFHWNPQANMSSPNIEYSARLPSEFDVMLYVDETTPSTLLPFR